MTHLWEVRHCYRCEEGCFFSRHAQSHQNYETWRDSDRAHPDMRQVITPLHEEFKKRVPIVFD